MSKSQTNFEVAKRRAIVARLYLIGKYQSDIAREVGVTQQQISLDLKWIHREWIKAAIGDFNEKKAQELARIDEVEREAWQAWLDSKQEKVITSAKLVKGDADRQESSKRTEQKHGAIEYLRTVQWCIEQRCKIFGFYAPTNLNIHEVDTFLKQAGVIEDGKQPRTTDGTKEIIH